MTPLALHLALLAALVGVAMGAAVGLAKSAADGDPLGTVLAYAGVGFMVAASLAGTAACVVGAMGGLG